VSEMALPTVMRFFGGFDTFGGDFVRVLYLEVLSREGPLLSRKSLMWFFGKSKERNSKRLLTELQTQTEQEFGPLAELGRLVVAASVNCLDSAKRLIRAGTEEERKEREILIFYECLYFYMHLTMRASFAVQLTRAQIEKLQGFLGPVLSSTAIGSYFVHWPDDLKHKMVGEFYEKLNQADVEYAECSRFDSPVEDQQIFRALFLHLGTTVSDLCRGETDVPLIMSFAHTAMSEGARMPIESLLAQFKAFI
jgi:hypothetical protein